MTSDVVEAIIGLRVPLGMLVGILAMVAFQLYRISLELKRLADKEK